MSRGSGGINWSQVPVRKAPGHQTIARKGVDRAREGRSRQPSGAWCWPMVLGSNTFEFG